MFYTLSRPHSHIQPERLEPERKQKELTVHTKRHRVSTTTTTKRNEEKEEWSVSVCVEKEAQSQRNSAFFSIIYTSIFLPLSLALCTQHGYLREFNGVTPIDGWSTHTNCYVYAACASMYRQTDIILLEHGFYASCMVIESKKKVNLFCNLKNVML